MSEINVVTIPLKYLFQIIIFKIKLQKSNRLQLNKFHFGITGTVDFHCNLVFKVEKKWVLQKDTVPQRP